MTQTGLEMQMGVLYLVCRADGEVAEPLVEGGERDVGATMILAYSRFTGYYYDHQ